MCEQRSGEGPRAEIRRFQTKPADLSLFSKKSGEGSSGFKLRDPAEIRRFQMKPADLSLFKKTFRRRLSCFKPKEIRRRSVSQDLAVSNETSRSQPFQKKDPAVSNSNQQISGYRKVYLEIWRFHLNSAGIHRQSRNQQISGYRKVYLEIRRFRIFSLISGGFK